MKKILVFIGMLLSFGSNAQECPACCCFIDIVIPISAIPDTCGQGVGEASVAPTGGVTPYTYLWSNNATTNPATGLVSGTYTVTVTDQTGCSSTNSVFVDDVGAPSVAIDGATTDLEICDGDTGFINVDVAGGTPGYTYAWDHGPTQEDISYTVGGTYTLTITDSAGCTASLSITVIVNPLPTPTASNGGPYCVGDQVQLSVNGYASYSWEGPQGFTSTAQNPTINNAIAPQSGTYSVTVTDSNGCTGVGSTNVVINSLPLVTFPNPGPLCQGDPPTTMNATPPGGTYVGLNVTGNQFNPLTSGSFLVTYNYTDANGCSNSADVTIVVLDPPSVVFSNPGPLCETDGLVNLVANPSGGVWGGNHVVGNQFDATSAGGPASHLIDYTYTDANGCQSYNVYTIVVDGQPDATLQTTLLEYCTTCETTRFENLTLYEPNNTTGVWFLGDQTGNCGGGTQVANPNNVVLNYGLNQFTFAVAGVGGCAGTSDCDVIDIYNLLELDDTDVELTSNDDPCDCNGDFVIDISDISNSGQCLSDFISDSGGTNTFDWQYDGSSVPSSWINGTSLEIPCGSLLANQVSLVELVIQNTSALNSICTDLLLEYEIDTDGCCPSCPATYDTDDALPATYDIVVLINISSFNCNGGLTFFEGEGVGGSVNNNAVILENNSPCSDAQVTTFMANTSGTLNKTVITLSDYVDNANTELQNNYCSSCSITLSGTEITMVTGDCLYEDVGSGIFSFEMNTACDNSINFEEESSLVEPFCSDACQ